MEITKGWKLHSPETTSERWSQFLRFTGKSSGKQKPTCSSSKGKALQDPNVNSTGPYSISSTGSKVSIIILQDPTVCRNLMIEPSQGKNISIMYNRTEYNPRVKGTSICTVFHILKTGLIKQYLFVIPKIMYSFSHSKNRSNVQFFI